MPDEPEGLQTAFLTIACGVPFLLIIFSYFTIWTHAKTAACYLRNLRSVYGLFKFFLTQIYFIFFHFIQTKHFENLNTKSGPGLNLCISDSNGKSKKISLVL